MKKLQTWILILALVASAAGAAAGTVLSGYVTGKVNVAVSQPLQVESANVTKVDGTPWGRTWFGAVSDAGTEFSAAVTLYQGESAMIKVPIINRADVDHVAEITVTAPVLPVPPGGDPSAYSITLAVNGSGKLSNDLVRVGPYKWKCTVDNGSNGTGSSPFDGIKITIALGAMVPPGYYEISGQIQVVAY